MSKAPGLTRRQVLLGGAAVLPSWILSLRAEAAFAALSAGQSGPPPTHRTKVIETQWIEMPDAAKLAARIFLPEDADEQHPVGAVFEYIPYRLRDRYRIADNYVGSRLAESGFAFVRVDIRGELLRPWRRGALAVHRFR